MIDLQQAGQGREGYELLVAQLEALLADERDFVANAAQFSACLLYTSPSPRDGLLSRMPSSA